MREYVKHATQQFERQQNTMLSPLSSVHQRSSPILTQLRQLIQIKPAKQLPHDRHDKRSHQKESLDVNDEVPIRS